MEPVKGLLDRLKDGETVLCAEGYVMDFERQGYIKSGPFVPEVVIDHPELVRQKYRDFVNAGSDVVPALTRTLIPMTGLPAVVTVAPRYMGNGAVAFVDGVGLLDGLRQLEAAGAAVVGFNCAYGPSGMVDLIQRAQKAGLKIPLAALPVLYRTERNENWIRLKDPRTGKPTYPTDIDCNQCNRSDVQDFTKKCIDLGIQYIGLCCGNAPHFTRTMAETLGRKPRASRYAPDMSLSVVFGTSDKIKGNCSKLYTIGSSKPCENDNTIYY
nr:betaine--homocysteine S-methyltransferase 1-like [Lytechinus pictus]